MTPKVLVAINTFLRDNKIVKRDQKMEYGGLPRIESQHQIVISAMISAIITAMITAI
jgi:hypothetical protein